MQCTVHFKVLEDIFNGRLNILQHNVILSAMLGCTTSILAEYHDNLKNNQSFLDWFAASTQSQRFKPVRNGINYSFPALTSVHTDHFVSAYYSNLMLLYSPNHQLDAADSANFVNWGIESVNASRLPTVHCTGDTPLFYVRLVNGGNKSPDIIKKYLIREKQIIVCDKFINNKSLDVLTLLFRVVDKHAEVTIITFNKPGTLSKSVISARLKAAYPDLSLKVHTMSTKTSLELHDRFIFVGDRYVIKFTKGLDCFFKVKGLWTNKFGDVIVDDNQKRYVNYPIELEDKSSILVKMPT